MDMTRKKKPLKTHENVSLDDYLAVTTLLKHPDHGIQLKHRRGFFVTYHSSFDGTEFVDWVLRNLAVNSREEAEKYGQKLVELGWVQSVNKKKFKDEFKNIAKDVL